MPHLIGYFPGGGGASGPKKKAFADCTWEEVSEICKAGLAGQYWNIGDTKEMIYGDSTKMLRIIGFDHDIVCVQVSFVHLFSSFQQDIQQDLTLFLYRLLNESIHW